MFGAGLSSLAAERKASKATGKGKAKSDPADKPSSSASGSGSGSGSRPSGGQEIWKPKERPDAPAILYDEQNPPPRELMIRYLQEVTTKMQEEITANQMAQQWRENLNKIGAPGLHLVCMEFQRDQLEYEFRIERNFGSRYLGMIPMKFPDDEELIGYASEFVGYAMHLYVAALKARASWNSSLRKKNKMTALEMSEFFEGCNALMSLAETKAKLRQVFLDTKAPPNEEIIAMQRQVINWIGLDADFGVSCLNTMQTDFPDDRELAMKVQQFALCAQVSCEIACMTDEQREEFMKEVPMFMKHCPHLHVMQKQMARQREMMAQRQAAMEQGGHVHAGHGPPMVGSDPESAKMMQDMMSDPESKEMMEKLSMRMNTTMQGVQKKVTSWAAAEKQSYWEGASQDPLLERLSACGPDVKKRLEMFRDLSDEEIERVMTIQFLMISHMQMGGRAGSEDAAQKSSSGSDGGVLGGLTKMLSGLSTGGSAPGGVGAAGGSGHIHTASCQHGTLPTAARAPDVTSGKLESMDR